MSKTALASPPPDLSAPAFRTFELAVEGERPTQHAHRIETLLAHAPGVEKVEAHLEEERVLITYDPVLTNPPAIHDRLIERGYRAAARAG